MPKRCPHSTFKGGRGFSLSSALRALALAPSELIGLRRRGEGGFKGSRAAAHYKASISVNRSWPCAPAHRLVSGEGASAPLPTIGIHECRSPKAQVANQTTTRLRTAIDLPGRQPPHRWRGKLFDLLVTP